MRQSQSETNGLTKQRAADFFGISLRQLERMVEKGMPREGSGRGVRFGPAAFAWHREYLAGLNQPAKEVGALTAEQARKVQIDADRAQLKLLKEQGELIPIRNVRDKQEAVNTVIRAKLLSIPTKLAPVLVGMKAAQIKGKIEAEVYECLEALSRQ